MVARMQGKVPGQKQIIGKLSNAIVDNSKILEYETHYEFPNVGKSHTIYIAKQENALYRWDDEALLYFSCSGSIDESEIEKKVEQVVDKKLDESIDIKLDTKIDEMFKDVSILGGNANG